MLQPVRIKHKIALLQELKGHQGQSRTDKFSQGQSKGDQLSYDSASVSRPHLPLLTFATASSSLTLRGV